MVRQLARELRHAAIVEPRLSISNTPAPCGAAPAPRGAGELEDCATWPVPTPWSARILRLKNHARREFNEHADPRALHVLGLVGLLDESWSVKSLETAISSFEDAARLSKHPAPILADLSAAYIIRAERGHTPRDLFAAIEAAEKALEHDPRNRVALFNRALALERFGLPGETVDAWRAYLAVDAGSAWAGVARRHLGGALDLEETPSPPAADAPDSALARYAAADPQGARILGWCGALDDWGQAVGTDETVAEAHLRRAEVLGVALEGRPGGDATLGEAVRAIRAHPGRAARLRLARAHREYAAGCALAARADFPSAVPRFEAATAAAEGSSVLHAWARAQLGDAVFHSGQSSRGECILREVVAWTDPVRYPALAGAARQSLAALLLRGDRYDAGLEQARRSAALFAAAGERENEGAAGDLSAIAHFRLFSMDAGYAEAQKAMERLRPYRSSYRLHNLLRSIARAVRDDGFARAAIRFENEGMTVAESTHNPIFVAEARLARARRRAAAGDRQGARNDLALGRRAMAQLTEPRVRGWMGAQRQMADAALNRENPARSAAALDSAADYLMGQQARLLALPPLVDAAQMYIQAGDVDRASPRLQAALGLLEQRRDSVRMEPRRAAVFEAARAVVDHMVMLRLAESDERGALRYLDRGRASLAPVGRAGEADTSRAVAGPVGEVVVVYALVENSLLAWTVREDRVEMTRSTVDTVRLTRDIERLRRQLEEGASEEALRPELSRLHEWLVRPVERRLGGPGVPLVVVTDGFLASVPFAALYDRSRKRYLVEDRPLRFAASLREARRAPVRSGGAGTALFVADPAFDRSVHPDFARLANAAREVEEITPKYSDARVLSSEEVTSDMLRAELPRAGLIHYAGHALFDEERPELSYLLLAPTPGKPGRDFLTASEIAQLDLRGLSLVVLSACQTVRTGPGRAAGFSGLAGAFLSAGAGGAIGSLWDVNDRLTRPLMVEFHSAYRRSGNGPEALRTAQLHLLRHGDERLRSPAAWAAFRYAGS